MEVISMRRYTRALARFVAIGSVALVALLMMVGAAGADTYTTGLESFVTGSVNGQEGWHSLPVPPALPNGYDQEVVNNDTYGGQNPGSEFGLQSLRVSNALAETTGEFENQTYSPSTPNPAGEAQNNKVFDGTFEFISTSADYQPGLSIRLSPDNGHGGRMSYLRLNDTPEGIQATFYDAAADGSFQPYDAGTYTRDEVHTVQFLIEFVPGPANDIVRLIIDGKDIGDELGVCFTTWEQYYRVSEVKDPPVTDSFEFRSEGSGCPTVAPDSNMCDGRNNLLGHGYLFDNVTTVTRNTDGPAPTKCGAIGAFCSPGFWKNASDAAWQTVAPITKTSPFNNVVVPNFYANNIISPPSTDLITLLIAKGATKFGKAAGPFGLNPYKAVGAALTSAIPGYVFDPNAYAQSLLGIDTCPLDKHGNVIPPA
jgi:hypothetical protein